MSPENDTPQHDDEAMAETVIAQGLAAAMTDDAPNYYRWLASKAVEALKETGFEITKHSELGVTKGLPGIATSLTERFGGIGQAASDIPGKLESIALDASASAAAKAGMELASRLLSISADDRLAAALDLIGRRSDVVAVQLPEPDDPSTWEYEFCAAMWSGFEDIDGEDGLDVAAFPSSDVWAGSVEIGVARYAPDVARRIAAAIFAAASRADAANVADAAEDEAK